MNTTTATLVQPDRLSVEIDYDEFEPSTYRGVLVTDRDTEHRFATGTISDDWQAAYRYLAAREAEGRIYTVSSLFYSFFDDGAPWWLDTSTTPWTITPRRGERTASEMP